MATGLTDLERALLPSGLIVRGAFHPTPADAVPGLGPGDATLVIVGNAGSPMWQAFDCAWPAVRRNSHRHPLDTWTREVVSRIAEDFGCEALYPSDGPPYLPFQRWAAKAEGLGQSPLGLLIHPDYGLWHAYRAALVFRRHVTITTPRRPADLCSYCTSKACLKGCPVNAFSAEGYDVPRCVEHLSTNEGSGCMDRGCAARRACPVGAAYVYSPAHAQFHMEKFRQSHSDIGG